MERKTWKEFKDAGMLWFINMILHAFGWAICLKREKGEIVNVYPARVKFRGFPEEANTWGYRNLSKYMKENADELLKEANDE